MPRIHTLATPGSSSRLRLAALSVLAMCATSAGCISASDTLRFHVADPALVAVESHDSARGPDRTELPAGRTPLRTRVSVDYQPIDVERTEDGSIVTGGFYGDPAHYTLISAAGEAAPTPTYSMPLPLIPRGPRDAPFRVRYFPSRGSQLWLTTPWSNVTAVYVHRRPEVYTGVLLSVFGLGMGGLGAWQLTGGVTGNEVSPMIFGTAALLGGVTSVAIALIAFARRDHESTVYVAANPLPVVAPIDVH